MGTLCLGMYRIYHPKKSLNFLSCFSFSCSSTLYLAFHSYYINSSSAKGSSPSSLKILQLAPKAPCSDFTLSCRTGECARSKFISESFKSKLNSDSSDENEMILEQNLDVLVPKYIGMINFACHFLSKCREQTEGPLCLVPG